MCLPYEKDGKTAAFYPDFIVVRYDAEFGYAFDVLEPHGQQFADNLPKARALAQYGKQEPRLGRLQLIRMDRDITGKNRLKRLDLMRSAVNKMVLQAQTTEELDRVFNDKGDFDI